MWTNHRSFSVAMHPPKASVDRFPKSWDDKPYRGQNCCLPHPRPRAAYAVMISDLDDPLGQVLRALDSARRTDLATRHPKLIARAAEILRDQVQDNPIFPVPIPGLRPKNSYVS
jgi:hypothetical protein